MSGSLGGEVTTQTVTKIVEAEGFERPATVAGD
jgi:hypothetical protein